jgi:hypothetical protein
MLIGRLSLGDTLSVACAKAGVNYGTCRNTMSRDHEFDAAVERARVDGQKWAIMFVMDALQEEMDRAKKQGRDSAYIDAASAWLKGYDKADALERKSRT